MNRPDDLASCLESVFAGSARPDEVIVSDDSPDSAPARRVAARYPVRYLVGPRQGLAHNRLQCVDVFTTDYVGFIDDDVVLPSGYLAAVRARLAEIDDHVVLTGSEVRHSGPETRIVHPHHSNFLGFQCRPASAPLKAIVINSTFFPRGLFAVCSFDERMRFGSEEIDIARQAVKAGFKVEHDPALFVDHYQSPINRASYVDHIDASRLYASAKNLLYFERKPLYALSYAVVAPIHLLAAGARSGGIKGARHAARSIRTAINSLLDYRRSQEQMARQKS